MVCYRDGNETAEFDLGDGGRVEDLQFFDVPHQLEWPAGSRRMSIAVWGRDKAMSMGKEFFRGRFKSTTGN